MTTIFKILFFSLAINLSLNAQTVSKDEVIISDLSFHLVDSIIPISIQRLVCARYWSELSKKEKKTITIDAFMSQCLRKDTIANCDCCFDMNSNKVRSKPFITLQLIDSVDWENQLYYINEVYIESIFNMVPNYGFSENDSSFLPHGIPTVLKVNNTPVYIMWFSLPSSSWGCDMSSAFINKDNNTIKIYFGSPNRYFHGEDPRFNRKIYNVLKENNKLIKNAP